AGCEGDDMTDPGSAETFPAFTPAKRSAALLHRLDEAATTRVACIVPGCRSELVCLAPHRDNLASSWRCIDHRTDPLGYPDRLGYGTTTPTKADQ
ncbi:MAG: hypothetical protein ABI662_09460, partial [Dermatophilaceae bacterium]